ncbi:MAG: TCR/Tet family MFS transporter [Tateyamaria sp.]|nr:TCR/Tet family MFS transporter [Tateyamaria sp.]MCH9746859.1 TCR/Tet family MFS transporter [Alphaproteobacteria bacterium]HAB39757.1 tetracycline resistance MFS efflux pump [Paracoccaceae bacterium]MBT5302289.1 TCR/Tet family MFS transporter [Tateyamaria sp.]MBT6342585.1 TCR/Tet family MFS transporter [Tateyamaria sp.]
MKLSVVFILITVLLDAMGIGLIVPVMPDLIQEVDGGDLATAALWGGVLSTSFAVMQFIFGPVLGGLSDRFGRRPVLLISLVVMTADYLVMAMVSSIWLLLIGRLVGGITAATQSTAAAYMADISKPEKKAANFGLIGAAFGMGFVIGPLIGGFLAEYGTRAPFYAAAILAALNAAFGWVILTETVTDRIRRPFSWSRANPVGTLRILGKLPTIGPLLLVYFLYQMAFTVYPAIWSYFGQERFGWSPAIIGLSLALFGIMLAIVQGGLMPKVLKILGERGAVIYGHGFDVAAFLALAFVTSGTIALILVPLASLAGVITPALQGIMSKAVGDDQQGELQGALTSVSALAMMISPMLMTSTFAAFSGAGAPIYLPGAPFLLSTGLILIGLAVFIRYDRTVTQ